MLAISKDLWEDDRVNAQPILELCLVLSAHEDILLFKAHHVRLQDVLDPLDLLVSCPDDAHARCVHNDLPFLLDPEVLERDKTEILVFCETLVHFPCSSGLVILENCFASSLDSIFIYFVLLMQVGHASSEHTKPSKE